MKIKKPVFITTAVKNSQQGFTLVELLLVIALLSISIGVTGDIMVSLTRSYNKTTVVNEIEQQVNFIGLKLEKELRNATNVTANSTQMQFDSGTGTVCYNYSNGNLYRTASAGICTYSTAAADALVATPSINQSLLGVNATCGANCFSVTSTSPQVVDIDMTFSQASGGGVSFSGNIVLRNTIVIRNSY
jgi:prepilin-type N-terminal cleavage/methylation domain-containing protein